MWGEGGNEGCLEEGKGGSYVRDGGGCLGERVGCGSEGTDGGGHLKEGCGG